MVRHNQIRRTARGGALEARLNQLFEGEIAAQGGRVPDLNVILLMAKIDTLNKRQERVTAIESWSEILALGMIVAPLAIWWEGLTSGFEALFPIAGSGFSWEACLGVATSLAVLLLLCSRALVRDG